MLVVGCKQSVDSGDPNWTTDEKDKKVWERDNSSNQYVRAFKQFGTSFNVTETVARLDVGNLEASKAGLIFGLSEYAEGSYRYFLVGVGGDQYQKTAGDYYIAYYYDVTPESISQSTNNQSAAGNMVTIQDNVKLSGMKISASIGYVYVGVKEEKSGDKTTVTVKIGDSYDEKKSGIERVGGTVTTKTFEIGTGASLENIGKVGDTGDKNKLKLFDTIKGGIGAYGMLKPPVSPATSTSTKNDYQVLLPSALLLSAEDAE